MSIAAALVLVADCCAAMVIVDPDSFPIGSDISFAFSGVTLSAFASGNVNGPDVSTPQVFVRQSHHASTGSRVFGNLTYTTLWFADSAEFRADFARPTRFVSLDLIGDDPFDPALLRAFDAAGNLLGEDLVAGDAGEGVAETATIERAAADIAYIVATNPDEAYGQQFLIDRLAYDAESVTLLLGDLNGDLVVDLNDIQPLLLALTNRPTFAALYPLVNPDLVGDLNQDGRLDNADIVALGDRLSAGGPGALTPEPGAAWLLVAGTAALPIARGSRGLARQRRQPRGAG